MPSHGLRSLIKTFNRRILDRIRKQAYSNILEILPPKSEFYFKKCDMFFPYNCSKHTKASLFKYTENLTTKILLFFFSLNKNSDMFHNSGQNIDYGYSREPPRCVLVAEAVNV